MPRHQQRNMEVDTGLQRALLMAREACMEVVLLRVGSHIYHSCTKGRLLHRPQRIIHVKFL